MAKDAIVHVRIDPADKEAAEAIYKGMGTTLSEAIRIFVKQSVLHHGFPLYPVSSSNKGRGKAQGILRMYAHRELREQEREAWIRSLSDKYETFNR